MISFCLIPSVEEVLYEVDKELFIVLLNNCLLTTRVGPRAIDLLSMTSFRVALKAVVSANVLCGNARV